MPSLGSDSLFAYNLVATSKGSNCCFSTFRTSTPVFIEVTFHAFHCPSLILPGLLGLLADTRFSWSSFKGDHKFHLSLIINIQIKMVFLVFLLNREAGLSQMSLGEMGCCRILTWDSRTYFILHHLSTPHNVK